MSYRKLSEAFPQSQQLCMVKRVGPPDSGHQVETFYGNYDLRDGVPSWGSFGGKPALPDDEWTPVDHPKEAATHPVDGTASRSYDVDSHVVVLKNHGWKEDEKGYWTNDKHPHLVAFLDLSGKGRLTWMMWSRQLLDNPPMIWDDSDQEFFFWLINCTDVLGENPNGSPKGEDKSSNTHDILTNQNVFRNMDDEIDRLRVQLKAMTGNFESASQTEKALIQKAIDLQAHLHEAVVKNAKLQMEARSKDRTIEELITITGGGKFRSGYARIELTPLGEWMETPNPKVYTSTDTQLREESPLNAKNEDTKKGMKFRKKIFAFLDKRYESAGSLTKDIEFANLFIHWLKTAKLPATETTEPQDEFKRHDSEAIFMVGKDVEIGISDPSHESMFGLKGVIDKHRIRFHWNDPKNLDAGFHFEIIPE